MADVVDLGQFEEREFYSYDITKSGLSYADTWPEYFKLSGTTIFRNKNLRTIDRSTYDFLNFLGDVGGL
jgi:hypothetical protein